MKSVSFQNTKYHEALYAAWGTQNPSRTAMPSISRLQKLVEAAWAQGFDLQVNPVRTQFDTLWLSVTSFHVHRDRSNLAVNYTTPANGLEPRKS